MEQGLKTLKILRAEAGLTLRRVFESTGIDMHRLCMLEDGRAMATCQEKEVLRRFYGEEIFFVSDKKLVAERQAHHRKILERNRVVDRYLGRHKADDELWEATT
jgi:hypothetical protein